MKYVYVLTSSINDLYYEQFFLSIVSLRLHNPKACIISLIDSKTKESLTGTRSGYEKYITEITVINAPESLSQKEVSRWIKTSVNKYVSGDFLYIDCDTVIAGNLDFNFPSDIKIGAILDTHVPLSKHHLDQHFKAEDKKLNFLSSIETDKRYNGGIIFCRDTAGSSEFYEKWHTLWQFSLKNGNHHDMPALNQANYEMGGIITEISDEWNCQITHNGLPYLSGAKIIHYYATALNFVTCPFIPASSKVLSFIKENGTFSDEIMEMLKNPKSAFEQDSRIISGEAELDVVNSKIFSFFLRLRKKKPAFFKSLNSFIIKIISKVHS